MERLTGRQAAMWFCFYYIGTATLILPASLVNIAKQDAWLSVFIAIGLHFLTLPLIFALSNQLQDKAAGDYLEAIVGKWPGKIALSIFIFAFPYLTFILTLRFLSDFITTSIMPATPSSAVYFLMLTAVVYVVRSGVATIGRTAEILFFLVLLFLSFLMISLVPNARLENLLPIFEHGLKPVITASFPMLAFPYLDSVIFLFLLPHFRDLKRWKSAIIKSSLLSGTIYLIVTLAVTAVLSHGVTANLTFASYFAVRTISVSDFYERFEALFTIVFYITVFFKLSLLLYVTAQGITSLFRLSSYKSLLIPLSLIGLIIADAAWPNIMFMLRFLRETWPYYAILFGLLLPMIIWAIGLLRNAGPQTKL